MPVLKKEIIDVLREVYDPEIPINVYDLGLIYDITIKNNSVHILMTLTSPSCPTADYIQQMIKEAVQDIREVEKVEVELTFDPAWTPERVAKEAKEELGLTSEEISQKAVEHTFQTPNEPLKEYICFNCSATDKQRPIFSCKYKGEQVFICSKCFSKF